MEFYGQFVLRVKLFPSAADSNSRKKSDYMLYNFFISSMKTHENFLSEDLHRKTFGCSKFVRFCDIKHIVSVFRDFYKPGERRSFMLPSLFES